MTISIISLSKDSVRRDVLLSRFKCASINVDLIEAVNGREIMASDYYPLALNEDYWFNRSHLLSPGEVGCKLSHCKALENFIEGSSNVGAACILEDDVSFRYSIQMINSLVEYVEKIKQPTVLHLGGLDGLSNSRRVLMRMMDEIDNIPIHRISKITLRWLYRTCAYIVNRSAARLMLDTFRAHNIVADNWNYISKKNPEMIFLFSNIVSHPIDLSTSSINSERTYLKR
jgi:glycosyl transferase, family 25